MLNELREVDRRVVLISAAVAFSLFGDSLLYSVLPLYAGELGIPLIAVGVILSINRWIRLVSNPLSARIFERLGAAWPLMMATVTGVLITFSYAWGRGLFVFLMARILWGFCWSHLRLGSYLVVLKTSQQALGLGMGVMSAVMRMGSTFTVLVGGWFVDGLGYRSGLTVMALLSVLSIPIMGRVCRAPREGAGEEVLTEAAGDDGQINVGASMHHLLCNLTAFTNHFISGYVIASLSLVLQMRLEGTVMLPGGRIGIATITGVLLAVRYSSSLFVSPAAGGLSDHWGRERTFHAVVALQALALMVFALFPHPVTTVLTVSLIFMLNNGLATILNAAAAESSGGEKMAVRMSVYASYQDLGSACGPFLGYIIGVYIDFTLAYTVGAALLLMLLGAKLTGLFSVPDAQKEKEVWPSQS